MSARAVCGLLAKARRPFRGVHWGRKLVALGIGGAAGAFGALSTVNQLPTRPMSITEVDGYAVRGRFLDLRYKSDRFADCGAKVERWLLERIGTDEHGEPIYNHVSIPDQLVPPIGIGLGKQWGHRLPLPDTVTPGQWYYKYRAYYDCRWGLRLGALIFGRPERDGGLIPVTVVDPPAGEPPAVVVAPGPVTVIPAEGKQ